MSYSLDLTLAPSQTRQQQQCLMMSPKMQRALHLLQLPILELEQTLVQAITDNPLFEIEDLSLELEQESMEAFNEPFSHRTNRLRTTNSNDLPNLEELAYREATLFEILKCQAEELIPEPHLFEIAIQIIGNLDERGFLTTDIDEIASLEGGDPKQFQSVLAKIQGFEPFGVAAHSLQESWLIQLTKKGKQETLAFAICQNAYTSLLYNRINEIARKVQSTPEKIQQAITQDIKTLITNPGLSLSSSSPTPTTPDILIQVDGSCATALVNTWNAPSIRLNTHYFQMLQKPDLDKETKVYLEKKLALGKDFLRSLDQRYSTLQRIATSLLSKQRAFLTTLTGTLNPMTMKALADELSVHESTIARACANKYISCPKGVFPLKALFTHGYTNQDGIDISSHTVKNILKELIANEDKSFPLSDQNISQLLKTKGLPCARRTISKYRKELAIPTAALRKKKI